jgi:hypothetical protein
VEGATPSGVARATKIGLRRNSTHPKAVVNHAYVSTEGREVVYETSDPVLAEPLRRLAQSVENLAVEQLIANAGVEALDVAVLPGAAPLDVGGLGTGNRD